jgi:hypothetical protein
MSPWSLRTGRATLTLFYAHVCIAPHSCRSTAHGAYRRDVLGKSNGADRQAQLSADPCTPPRRCTRRGTRRFALVPTFTRTRMRAHPAIARKRGPRVRTWMLLARRCYSRTTLRIRFRRHRTAHVIRAAAWHAEANVDLTCRGTACDRASTLRSVRASGRQRTVSTVDVPTFRHVAHPISVPRCIDRCFGGPVHCGVIYVQRVNSKRSGWHTTYHRIICKRIRYINFFWALVARLTR